MSIINLPSSASSNQSNVCYICNYKCSHYQWYYHCHYRISNKCKIPLEAPRPRWAWGGKRLAKTLRACRACCRVCSFLYIGWRSRRRRWWCCASSGHFEAANDRCLARPTCQLGWACLHAHLAGCLVDNLYWSHIWWKMSINVVDSCGLAFFRRLFALMNKLETFWILSLTSLH